MVAKARKLDEKKSHAATRAAAVEWGEENVLEVNREKQKKKYIERSKGQHSKMSITNKLHLQERSELETRIR